MSGKSLSKSSLAAEGDCKGVDSLEGGWLKMKNNCLAVAALPTLPAKPTAMPRGKGLDGDLLFGQYISPPTYILSE